MSKEELFSPYGLLNALRLTYLIYVCDDLSLDESFIF